MNNIKSVVLASVLAGLLLLGHSLIIQLYSIGVRILKILSGIQAVIGTWNLKIAKCEILIWSNLLLF